MPKSEFVCPECGGKDTARIGHKTGYQTQLTCDVDECTWESYVRNPQGRVEKKVFDPVEMHIRRGSMKRRTGDDEE